MSTAAYSCVDLDSDDLEMLQGRGMSRERELFDIADNKMQRYEAVQLLYRREGRRLPAGTDMLLAFSSWDREWESRLSVADIAKIFQLDEETVRERQTMVRRRMKFLAEYPAVDSGIFDLLCVAGFKRADAIFLLEFYRTCSATHAAEAVKTSVPGATVRARRLCEHLKRATKKHPGLALLGKALDSQARLLKKYGILSLVGRRQPERTQIAKRGRRHPRSEYREIRTLASLGSRGQRSGRLVRENEAAEYVRRRQERRDAMTWDVPE